MKRLICWIIGHKRRTDYGELGSILYNDCPRCHKELLEGKEGEWLSAK